MQTANVEYGIELAVGIGQRGCGGLQEALL